MGSPSIYAAINSSNKVRKISSSGAVFYEISKYIINNKKGVVFGARFNSSWEVVHDHSSTMDGVMDFLGSKYVQSKIGDEYRTAKTLLDKGVWVLFSGTPCQIEALLLFLGKKYSHLITVDFVCHGVPSPAVWKKYLEHVANGREIQRIAFRDKSEGWKDFSLCISFANGESYREKHYQNAYMKGFEHDIYLRPSCYQCCFKGMDRKADITLADFWGVEKFFPEMFDDEGTSLVLIHSESAKIVWNNISGQFKFCEVDKESASKFNPNMLCAADLPKERAMFFKNGIQSVSMVDTLIEHHSKRQQGIILCLKVKLKSVLRKMIRRNTDE